jgi:amidophosphoribosyltransferase
MATYKELVAANLTIDQIRARVGADSLGYLSVERLVESTGRERSDFCLGCLTGAYPSSPVMAMAGADRQPALKL